MILFRFRGDNQPTGDHQRDKSYEQYTIHVYFLLYTKSESRPFSSGVILPVQFRYHPYSVQGSRVSGKYFAGH